MTAPPNSDEGVGCRPGALAALALVGAALLIGGIGLWLVTRHGTGLPFFYAAAPVSALFGVLGGGLPVAWPLDLAVWVVAGTWAGIRSARTVRPLWQITSVIGVAALAYGLVMSLFVEVDLI